MFYLGPQALIKHFLRAGAESTSWMNCLHPRRRNCVLTVSKTLAEYGIELTYTSPEVILNAVERNESLKNTVSANSGLSPDEDRPQHLSSQGTRNIKVVLTLDEKGDIIIAQA